MKTVKFEHYGEILNDFTGIVERADGSKQW